MRHRPRITRVDRSGFGAFLWRVRIAVLCGGGLDWLRDRLRCFNCGKVGTYKPHDNPPRWLCKWCGYYEDINRKGWCRPCLTKRVWMLKPLRPGQTPSERCGTVDPWRG